MSFEIDGGMEEGEQFPGELNVEFDMKQLGIPSEYEDVVKIDKYSSSIPLYAQTEGRKV